MTRRPAPDGWFPELLIAASSWDCPILRRLTVERAKDKLRILADIDRATGTGATGAILRREGIYSSTLSAGRT
jgi:hypothetical protein